MLFRSSRDLVSHLENSVRAFELIAEKVHTITAGHDPVSYTHLDVYKRQVVGRYVSGEQDSLSADERLALFNAGVRVASMEKARRGVRLIESFEQDSNCLLYTSRCV